EAAEATEKDARQTYQRIEKLAPKSASQQQLDDAKGEYEAAAARTKAAQAALDLAVAGPRKEDIAEAKATFKRYEVELAQAKRDLKDAHLYAPGEGVIENRLLERGDMASPLKPVFTLALVDPIWIRAYVPEPQLGKLRPGMQAQVTTDSFPGKSYDGWIGFISPAAEFTPKPVETQDVRTQLVYEVRVFVRNPQGQLRLGMPATVTVSLDQPPGADGGRQADSRPKR
ncbi:MAG TPA: efflux RND transporter periplasmic adaptor subunit, partial [Thermomicrobiales bacterium]|nr:efflux RND transporter periplasmic adaptor subunit [Thermomicrobiales bacterium]